MINSITLQITPIIQKPEPAAIQHIENLERIRKRRAEEQRHNNAACYDQLGQRLQGHEQAALIDLVI
jgi:hypothetical protein